MSEEKSISHESFGMLSSSRVQRTERTLFGSSIPHSNTIRLSLSTARMERDLYSDRYIDDTQLVEVEMSQSHFAELITSLNIGGGVPITIRRLDGKHIFAPEEINRRQVLEAEYLETVNEISNQYKKITENVSTLIDSKKLLNKAEKEELSRSVQSIGCLIISTMPFLSKDLNEHMDKTVLEAKCELDAFVQSRLNTLGIESLQDRFSSKTLLGAVSDSSNINKD